MKETFEAECILRNVLIIMLMSINAYLNVIELIQIAVIIKSFVYTY